MLRTTPRAGAPAWMGSRQAPRVSHTSRRGDLTTIPVLHSRLQRSLDLPTACSSSQLLDPPCRSARASSVFSWVQPPGDPRALPVPCTLHGGEQCASSSLSGRWSTREKPSFVLIGVGPRTSGQPSLILLHCLLSPVYGARSVPTFPGACPSTLCS